MNPSRGMDISIPEIFSHPSSSGCAPGNNSRGYAPLDLIQPYFSISGQCIRWHIITQKKYYQQIKGCFPINCIYLCFCTITCKHPMQNLHNTKNTILCCNCMKKYKRLGQRRTAPDGQGKFQQGNSTGTVPMTGFGKILDLEIDTKTCLRVLQLKVLKLAANT